MPKNKKKSTPSSSSSSRSFARVSPYAPEDDELDPVVGNNGDIQTNAVEGEVNANFPMQEDFFFGDDEEPRYLRNSVTGTHDVVCEYIFTGDGEEEPFNTETLESHFNQQVIPSTTFDIDDRVQSNGYLRESNDSLRLSGGIVNAEPPTLLELDPSHCGFFDRAYGSYGGGIVSEYTANPYNPYGDGDGGDNVFGDIGLINVDMDSLDNIEVNNESDTSEEPEEPDEDNDDIINSTELQLLTKQHEFSVVSTVNRRAWVRCGCPTDWNKMFQELLEMDDSTEEVCLLKYRKLSALSADFVHTAKNFGKIIISESKLHTTHQTLSPHPTIGGEAGGEKYIYHGILFKFATDWKGIYKSDENAMKAAGHELKGVMRYAQCEGLHVPLVAIIDYRGYRLVAESILPFRGQSLHYGSSDGGKTVKKTSEELNKRMKKAGEQLNIKGHYGGLFPNTREFIYGPTDIEGHIGTDKRFYVIDFARVFPPTVEEGVSKTFLYKLFRPEFIKSYKIPLSSDGFSHFGRHNAKEHNSELKEATKYLLQTIIPNFSTIELIEMFPLCEPTCIDYSKYSTEIKNITELVHRAGINVRYLGLIREYTAPHLKPSILNEVCSRTIKNKLRALLREKSQGLTQPQEDLFRQAAINFLNIVLGHDNGNVSASNFWKKTIKESILRSFGKTALTDEEKHHNFDLRTHIDIFRLFKRVQELTGVGLTKQAQKDLKSNPESFQIVQSDINKVAAKVKHMNTISLAEAKALAIASMKGSLGSERLFRLACSKFEIAIQATPDNLQSLNAYASFLVEYAKRNPSREGNLQLFSKAFEKFKTTKNYDQIYQLSETLQEIPHFTQERDEVIVKCFEIICEGITDKKSKLWTTSMLSWGDCLVSQARRSNSIDIYKSAGEIFRKVIDSKGTLNKTLQKIQSFSKDISNIEIAIIFEIYKQDNTLSCFDSSWCFKSRLISVSLLSAIVSNFRVKIFRISHCDSLTSSQIVSILEKTSCLLLELDLSYCNLVDDMCLNTIRKLFEKSLVSLNLAECKKITKKGFNHLSKCSSISTLNISSCQDAHEFVGMFHWHFSSLRYLNISKCDNINSKALCGLEHCYQLEELDLAHLPITSLKQLNNLNKLKTLRLSGSAIATLDPLLIKDGILNIECLHLRDIRTLDGSSLRKIVEISPNLRELNLRGCKLLNNSDIEHISEKCPNLTHFSLGKSDSLTNDCLILLLNRLTKLKSLYIWNFQLENIISQIEHGFTYPDLEVLSLVGTDIRYSVSFFCNCPNIRSLNLSHNKELVSTSFVKILPFCKKITNLEVEGCIRLTDDTIEAISNNLLTLEYLNLSACQLYSDVAPLVKCKELKSLLVENCKKINTDLLSILINNSYLREINFRGCMLVGDGVLESILNCNSLIRLSLGGNKISSVNLQKFITEAKTSRPDLFITKTPSLLTASKRPSFAKRVAATRK